MVGMGGLMFNLVYSVVLLGRVCEGVDVWSFRVGRWEVFHERCQGW